LRPTVDVELSLGRLAITTKALIDTGAPRSVFPRGVGDLLAVEFPKFPSDAPKTLTLMGRAWPAVTETVNMLLRPFEDLGWQAEVDFVLEDDLPFALLGYEGFLNRWAVSFNGYIVDGSSILAIWDQRNSRSIGAWRSSC
jgi:hypothetical protein